MKIERIKIKDENIIFEENNVIVEYKKGEGTLTIY